MALLVLLFAAPAILWGLLLLRWGTTFTLGIVVLIAGTLFGPPFFHIDGPFQISAERVLWMMLLGMFVVHWRLGRTDPKSLGRADWLLLAFVGFTALSTQMGEAPDDGSNPVARWLFYVAMPCGMYFVARGSHLRSCDLRHGISAFVGVAVYLAITAVLEARGLHSLVFPAFIVDPEIWEFYGRGRGPLLNPAANGVVMTIGLGATLVRWLQAGRSGKIGYALATLVILAGCYATLTRCVWMGAAAVLAIVALQSMPRGARIWAAVSVVLVGGSMGLVFKDQLLKLKRDKDLSAEASLKSLELRPLLAIIAVEMFQERPLVGYGYGHYFAHNAEFAKIREWEKPLQVARPYMQHNILLSILVDCGLVGLAMYTALLCWWIGLAWRLYRDKSADPASRDFGMILLATLIGYFASGMFQDVTVLPMVHMYLLFIAGVAAGIHARPLLADCRTPESGRLREQPLRDFGPSVEGYVT